jgi:S1-C subfamily serine protease
VRTFLPEAGGHGRAWVALQIIKVGRVTRPIIGISFAPDMAVEGLGVSGVLVLEAAPNGPASKAGINPTKRDEYGRLVLGDIIIGIDKTPIKNSSDLFKCVLG